MSPEAFEHFNKMNHDIRTQLNVVITGMHLLSKEPQSDRSKELMHRMSRSIDKANSILDLAYDELRKDPVNERPSQDSV